MWAGTSSRKTVPSFIHIAANTLLQFIYYRMQQSADSYGSMAFFWASRGTGVLISMPRAMAILGWCVFS
jgi:hypothetical protein